MDEQLSILASPHDSETLQYRCYGKPLVSICQQFLLFFTNSNFFLLVQFDYTVKMPTSFPGPVCLPIEIWTIFSTLFIRFFTFFRLKLHIKLTTRLLLAIYIVTTFCWKRPSFSPLCWRVMSLRSFLLSLSLGSSVVVWFPARNTAPQYWQATDGGVRGISKI